MKYFYEAVRLSDWNIFNIDVGHIEPFVGTNEMKINDLVVLNIGKNFLGYQKGVYGIGLIVKEPYINYDNPNDHCYGQTTVDIKILYLNQKIFY